MQVLDFIYWHNQHVFRTIQLNGIHHIIIKGGCCHPCSKCSLFRKNMYNLIYKMFINQPCQTSKKDPRCLFCSMLVIWKTYGVFFCQIQFISQKSYHFKMEGIIYVFEATFMPLGTSAHSLLSSCPEGSHKFSLYGFVQFVEQIQNGQPMVVLENHRQHSMLS